MTADMFYDTKKKGRANSLRLILSHDIALQNSDKNYSEMKGYDAIFFSFPPIQNKKILEFFCIVFVSSSYSFWIILLRLGLNSRMGLNLATFKIES